MAGIKGTLGLLIYCLTLSTVVYSWFDDCEQYTEIGPKDPKVCLGETLTITCNVKDGFEYNSSEIILDKPVDSVQIVNDTHVLMTILKFNGPDLSTACCKIKSDTCSPQMSCQTIQAYDAPLPVSNLTCVVNDWSDNLNCSWNHGTTYKVRPSVKFEWRIRYSSCNWKDCPDYNQHYNYCFFRNTSVARFSMKVFDIKITVKSKCGREVVNYYTINTKTIVKPAPVLDLRKTVLNSTCVNVTWGVTRREYTKIFEVSCSSKWNDTQVQIFNANDTGKSKYNEAIFCDLIPNTTYSVTVRVKPSQSYWSHDDNNHTKCGNCTSCNNTKNSPCDCMKNDGYWSDIRLVKPTTYGDVPSASPSITKGSFRWDPDECNKIRLVSIYWKPIEPIARNGELKAYVVTLSDGDDVTTHETPGDRCSLTLAISCSSDTMVTIQGRNNNGTSHKESRIQIMASTKGIIPPRFMVEMSNYSNAAGEWSVYIEWDVQDRADVTGFTVFRCKKEKGDCADDSHIMWQSVGRQDNSTMLLLKSPEDYLYSVSMEKSLGSSGMQWESCIFTRNAVPDRAPSNVDAQASSKDRAIFVSWEKLTCKSGKPYIDKYFVQYCNGDSCGEVETKSSSFLLEDLEVGQVYHVRVRGVTRTGELGPWSEPVEAKPDGWKTGEIAGVAVGGVFGFVVMIAGFICIVKKCHGRVKKTFTPPGIKDIFKTDLTGLDNEVHTCENEDKDEKDKQKEEGYYVTLDSDTPPFLKQLSVESGFVDVGSPDSIRNNEKAFFKDQSLPEEDEKKMDEKRLQQERHQQLIQDGYVITTNVSNLSDNVNQSEQVVAQVGFVELSVAGLPATVSFKNSTLNTKKTSVIQRSDNSSDMAYVQASALEDADNSVSPSNGSNKYSSSGSDSDLDTSNFLPDSGSSSETAVDSYVKSHTFPEAVSNSYVTLPQQTELPGPPAEIRNQSSSTSETGYLPWEETYMDQSKNQDSPQTNDLSRVESDEDQSKNQNSSQTDYLPWSEGNEEEQSNDPASNYSRSAFITSSNIDQDQHYGTHTGNYEENISTDSQQHFFDTSAPSNYLGPLSNLHILPCDESDVVKYKDSQSLEGLVTTGSVTQPSNHTGYVPVTQLEKTKEDQSTHDNHITGTCLDGEESYQDDNGYISNTLSTESNFKDIAPKYDCDALLNDNNSFYVSGDGGKTNADLVAVGYVAHEKAMGDNQGNNISPSYSGTNDIPTFTFDTHSEKTDSDSSGFGSLEAENKEDFDVKGNCQEDISKTKQDLEDLNKCFPNQSLPPVSKIDGYVPQEYLESNDSSTEENIIVNSDAIGENVPLDFYRENSLLNFGKDNKVVHSSGKASSDKMGTDSFIGPSQETSTDGYVSHKEGDRLLNNSMKLHEDNNNDIQVENGYISYEEAVKRESLTEEV